MSTTIVTSGRFTLNLRDLANGLIVAVLGAVVPIIYATINTGSLVFDWPTIGKAAAIAGIGYLLKNFFTPEKIVVEEPTKAQVDTVKHGENTNLVIPVNSD